MNSDERQKKQMIASKPALKGHTTTAARRTSGISRNEEFQDFRLEGHRNPKPVSWISRSFVLCGITLTIGLSAFLPGCSKLEEMKKLTDAITQLEINDVDIATLQDGERTGFQDNGVVTANVKVLVKNGKIESVNVLDHNHGPGKNHDGSGVAQRVVAAQSLDVDAVSGATSSSKVVLKAIEKALTGEKDSQ